jgi:hypothetical protein
MTEYIVSTCVEVKARFGALDNARTFVKQASKNDPAFTYYVTRVETTSEQLAVFSCGKLLP